MSDGEKGDISWREILCTEYVNSQNYRDSVKGEPMRAISAYNNRGCRCDNCQLARKLRSSEYYAENSEKNKEKVREYYQANRERKLEYHRKYRQENREELLEKSREYQKTPAGKATVRRKHLKRRSTDAEFFESMTEEEHSRFFAISEFFHPVIETHVDHVLPVSLGGTSHPDNLCVLTAAENLHKNDTHPNDWPVHTVPLAGTFRYPNNS